MKFEILFLKVSVCIAAILILAFYIFGLPSIAKEAPDYYPVYLVYPTFISLFSTAIPLFFGLYQTFRLLTYINKKKFFSELSIKALKNIKYCAIVFGILYTTSLPFLYIIAEIEDAPGILAFGLIITFSSIVIAMFVSILQKLFKSTMDK